MITKTLLQAIKPFRLVSLITTYILGAGLVQYVRTLRDYGLMIQGGIFILCLVLSVEFIRVIQQLLDPNNWPKDSLLNEIKRLRWTIALITATLLTVIVIILIDWMVRGILWQGLTLLLFGFFISLVVYYIADIRRSLLPYRILIEVLIFVVFPPAISFFLHSPEPHRVLSLVFLGFIPVYLAYRILVQIKSYQHDHQYEIITFVTYAGWERAMVLHNALILVTFLIFAIIAAIGFPWFLLWPVFLVFPIGLLEIWLMERVRRGAKPMWGLMQLAAGCVFFIPIYLVGFAFWIR